MRDQNNASSSSSSSSSKWAPSLLPQQMYTHQEGTVGIDLAQKACVHIRTDRKPLTVLVEKSLHQATRKLLWMLICCELQDKHIAGRQVLTYRGWVQKFYIVATEIPDTKDHCEICLSEICGKGYCLRLIARQKISHQKCHLISDS